MQFRRQVPCSLVGIVVGLSTAALLADSHTPSEALNNLFEREWDYRMEESPTWASMLGDRRWNDEWPEVDPEAHERRQQHRLEVLKELEGIERSELSRADRLNYDLFRRDLEEAVTEHRFGWHLIPLTQRRGIQTADELADALRFSKRQDFEDWLSRLRRLPEYLQQTRVLMEEGIRQKMLLPQVVMKRVPDQIEDQIVDDPKESPFFRPFREMPDSWTESAKAGLTRKASKAIADEVVPAFREFHEFFETTYLPACYEKVGISHLPDGRPMYEFFARKFTTTDRHPQQIHKLGLSEVKRIRSEMDRVIDEVGFEGSRQDFFESLRTDPQFYYSDPDELLRGYRAIAKRIDPEMVHVAKQLPRTPYGVEPIPEKIAPDTTTAYYRRPAADGSRAGTYFVNLHEPESRPKYEMMALSLHEAVPGHHLQIARAMELEELPRFRRYTGYTAYTEGWALYAESLGDELGLYDDPYSKFGQLTYEMWRAVRLVVDTGIHYLGWDRQKAIDYFLDNAPKSRSDVINEVDRYIAWPGQALAYKIGELKIKELRSESQEALGEEFDIRAFHDRVLSFGSIPLDILEREVERWHRQETTSNQE